MEEVKLQNLLNDKFLLLIGTITQNRNNILDKAYDDEYLHKLRVSVRKIRAISSLLDNYFKKTKASKCKKRFSIISKSTNEARDLDVYLIKLELYKNDLSDEKKEDLKRLIEFLETEKNAQYIKLQQFLQSKDYQSIIVKYNDMIEQKKLFKTSSLKDTKTIAKDELLKIYEMIIKQGKCLNEKSSNSQFHELRISFKKIRYLLELFLPLYDENGAQKLILDLKGIQTLLGDFNDYDVQQAKLKSFIEKYSLTENEVATLEILIKKFENERNKIKEEFKQKFKKFCHSDFKSLLLTI